MGWRKRIFSGITALFIFLFLGKTVFCFSQQNLPVVTKITVRNEGPLSTEGIKELISIKEGEYFSLKKISHSIKQIYKTGLFSDVRVLKEGEKKIELTFLLTKQLLVRKINIKDSREIPGQKIKKGLYMLRKGSSFSQYKLNKSKEQIKRILRREGYFSPQLEIKTEKKPDSSLVDVVIEVYSAKRYVIDKIEFSGETVIEEEKIKAKMKSKEGEWYVPLRLEEDIQSLEEFLSSKGYFWANIEVERKNFEEKRNKVSLYLKVVPNQKIRIEVKGMDIPLRILTSLWEERIFEEWGLDKGEAKIIQYLRRKNYIFASVNSSIKREDNQIRVMYEVNPGKKYKIGDLEFKGLHYFTPLGLKKELGLRKGISFIGGLDGVRVFELPLEIERLYKSHGFPDTQVDLNFARFNNTVKPIFFITEGKQEKIKEITFQGLTSFSRKEILEQLESKEEEPFYRPRVRKDTQRLKNFYLDRGFRGTEVSVQVNETQPHFFSLLFKVHEGNRVKIENVIITGNVVTKKNTILRELKVKEGDFALYGALRESKRKLERLGIFSEVKIEEILLSPSKENLLINVREGKRNYASLGLGLETKEQPRSLDIAQNLICLRGTAEIMRSNILGTAAQLSLVGQFSVKERRGVVSWEQPYFFGLPLETYLNSWLEREFRKSFSFDRRGISLTTIKPLSETEDMVVLTTLRWAQTTLFDLKIAESEVDRQHSPFSASSISGSFIWDQRDDAYNPRQGYFFSSVLEWAYPVFGAESNYIKSFTKYQSYFPLFSRVRFSLTSRLGLGRGKIPVHERFFGGGSNSFRGEEFDELGPEDPNSFNPVGGKALFLMNFELTFPLYSSLKNLYGVVFYDKGNVFAQSEDFSLTALQDAVGAGLRYRTPLGPIRLELGWNLDAPKREKDILVFITIGNVF